MPCVPGRAVNRWAVFRSPHITGKGTLTRCESSGFDVENRGPVRSWKGMLVERHSLVGADEHKAGLKYDEFRFPGSTAASPRSIARAALLFGASTAGQAQTPAARLFLAGWWAALQFSKWRRPRFLGRPIPRDRSRRKQIGNRL